MGRNGFTNGPRRLNTVLTFNVRRKGATALRAGCQPTANKNAIPTSENAAKTFSLGAFRLTPSASNTSAEPTRLDAERLPCLATGTPDAAATKATAVEILKVEAPSPPVPQVSIAGVGEDWSCNTSAIPASSWAVTPLIWRAAKIAPDSTGGITSFSHPCISSAAWDRDRDWRSNNCCSSIDQASESIMVSVLVVFFISAALWDNALQSAMFKRKLFRKHPLVQSKLVGN